MNQNRQIKQREAFNAWLRNMRSTLNLCTGFGKTYMAIMIARYVYDLLKKDDFKCLIIVPTEVIRDDVFPSEFIKFGQKELLSKCEISCIQTVYKYENQYYDLVICDEIHNYLYRDGETNEYFKFFENNTYKYILGLSASIDDDKLASLNKIAPISYVLTLDQAVKLGIISPFRIFNVEIELTDEEKREYNRLLHLYTYYERILGGKWHAFSNSLKFLKEGNEDEKRNAAIFRSLIKKRKDLLNNAANKIVVTNKILTFFTECNGIIFSESIEQCHRLVGENEKIIAYHSKMKKKEKRDALDRLNDGRTKVKCISAVRGLNEGLSIDSIVYNIITAGNGKMKDMIQRTGRSCRYVEDKIAYIFRLYVKGTQEEKWVRKSQEEFDKTNIYFVNTEMLWKILERSL